MRIWLWSPVSPTPLRDGFSRVRRGSRYKHRRAGPGTCTRQTILACNRACRCFAVVAGARAQPRPGTVNIGWPLDVALTSSWSTSQCSAMQPSSTR